MGGVTEQPELQGASIVAVGSFNPAIFQPLWFSMHQLIREEEAESADIQIVHKDAAIFNTEWFSLQVLSERFALDTNDPSKTQPLRDLISGTFRFLEHTPIAAFGFNRQSHYRMESEAEWHTFGHHYAPKESWNEILANPGLRNLIIQGKRENCDATYIQVRLEPSTRIHPGLFMQVNEHYQMDADPEKSAQDRMMLFLTKLQEAWDPFLSYSDAVLTHLISEAHAAKD